MKNRFLQLKQKLNNWKWIECQVTLHSQNNQQESYRLLETNYKIMQDCTVVEESLQFNIQMQKSFNFSKRIGWNWHKSWKLPEITVKPILNNYKLYTKGLRCRLICGYVEDVSTIRQVDLEGNTEKLYNDEIQGFQFENIKFSSTSYKLEGVHFHIIIEIYRRDDIFESELTIKSVISPPIFVDSRKAARNTKRFDYQKIMSLIQPFHPFTLKKQLIVRSDKSKILKIEDTLEGLNNYLMAQNIRNKCRHPYFLTLKFRSVFDLYYNSNLYSAQLSLEQLLVKIQQCLVDSLNSHQNQQVLLLRMKYTNYSELDMGFFSNNLNQLQNNVIQVLAGSQIDKNWLKINSNDLNNIYQEKYSIFPRVSNSDQQQMKQYFDISSDESDSEVCCQNDEQIELGKQQNLQEFYETKIEIQKKKVCL
ncbi:unnamed protein product [Paramecium pentaurelia]|uniref:Uncharacterized protein n=1 Tax=Paramecium pentaurelia TaxID=43138 RepID=A0A8S1SVJ2_9CILI|nr:unnamed protein product [Paramecium pentaurelia]